MKGLRDQQLKNHRRFTHLFVETEFYSFFIAKHLNLCYILCWFY